MTDLTDDTPSTGGELADIIPAAPTPSRRRRSRGQAGERAKAPRNNGEGGGETVAAVAEIGRAHV